MPIPLAVFRLLQETDFTAPENKLTRAKAIRWKCIDCMAGQQAEIKSCAIKTCPLWPYRMGRRLREDEGGLPEPDGPETALDNGPDGLEKIAEGLD
jgi:hypothetical protein